ncbi:nucleoporin Nup85-like protein [Parasitella parasitica]|nr:nucleoporin Nup85-like protein [Parasitella parasitica]
MTNNRLPTESYANKRDPYLALDSDIDKQVGQKQQAPSLGKDLLSEKLRTINAAKSQSKEQFYHESYSIFYELRSYLESHQSQLSQESALGDRDVIGILSKYVDLTHQYTEAKDYIKIWDLCQRLYFPMESTDLIISLRDWLNSYDELPNVEEARCQDPDEELEEKNPIGPTWIWEYSRRHLLRGNLEEASNMLSFGLSFLDPQQQTAVKRIIELIAGLDDIVSAGDNKTVFWERWAVWSELCKANYKEFLAALQTENRGNEKNDEIWSLCNILVGEEKYISLSGSYFEVVLGNVWFAKPQSSLSSLKSLAQDVENTATDDACSFILMGQFDEAFCTLANDLWFHTHLGYALIITGNITTDQEVAESSTCSENIIHPIYYSIQAYAQKIAQEFGMLEEAIHYLNCCQSNKEIWINQILGDPILPLKNNDYILSLLDIATKYGLPQVEKHIHKGLGRRYEHERKIRQATIEYGKAEDLQSLDRLSHHEFSQYLRTGKLGDVVSDMDSLKKCPHYAILITYHELRGHLSHKRWKEASDTILCLLDNEHLPPKFTTVLLIDNLQILKVHALLCIGCRNSIHRPVEADYQGFFESRVYCQILQIH